VSPEPQSEVETVSLPEPPAGPSEAETAAPDRDADVPPPEVDRYAVEAEVGRGGMGRVLSAEDQVLRRKVALKVLRTGSEEARRRFAEEARITSQLDHPNVLPVYDLGVDPGGNAFFTMKLVRGHTSLAHVIERLRARDPEAHERLTFPRRVQLVQQVCHALAYAHRRGVVHRDLKPHNVVLGPYGEVYLVDWGIARVLPDAADGEDRIASEAPPPAAEPRAATGTPAYMAPEQVRTGEVSARSDVYSLTAVLYELLTLHYYLGPVEPEELLYAIVAREPVPAESHRDPLNGRVPRSLSKICERGLAKDPAQRYASAGELEEALERWLEGRAPIVCPGTCMQRVLRRWSYWIDQHPFLVPIGSIVLAVLFVRWLVVSVWSLVQLATG